jgi:hypothetical protein
LWGHGVGAAGVTTDDDLQLYLNAFDVIDADPAHLLLVATDGAQVLATMEPTRTASTNVSGSSPLTGAQAQAAPLTDPAVELAA